MNIGEYVDEFLAPVAPLSMSFCSGLAPTAEESAAAASALAPNTFFPVGSDMQPAPGIIGYVNSRRVKITTVNHDIRNGQICVQWMAAPKPSN